jgi:hypothetical protein
MTGMEEKFTLVLGESGCKNKIILLAANHARIPFLLPRFPAPVAVTAMPPAGRRDADVLIGDNRCR